MHVRFALAVLLAAIVALGNGRADAAETTTAAITGTVTAADGAAIAAARVAAAGPAGRYQTTSDVRGAFHLLGVTPGTYTLSVEARGYDAAIVPDVDARPAAAAALAVRLTRSITTIGRVRSNASPIAAGSTSERFTSAGDPSVPTENAAGLAAYTAGTVQGVVAGVPGVNLDTFGNAIVRGGKIDDTVFEIDSVPVPQGLIAEPGGNIVGAQLATTGTLATSTTLGGFSNQGENALGGIVDLIPLTGTFPAQTTIDLTGGIGTPAGRFAWQSRWATPDLRWRSAVAATFSSEAFAYGDGHTFYPSEAATYGLSLSTRGTASITGNVHYQLTPNDDLAFLALWGEANYHQYGSPYGGETVGAFDGAVTPFPGETTPAAPVTFASGLRGTYDVLKLQWLHASNAQTARVQLYQTQFGSTAGGPFWDDLSFPDGVISFAATQGGRETGLSFDVDHLAGARHHLLYGLEGRVNTSFLDQIVPTADERITSDPTLFSTLAYVGDTWEAGERVSVAGTARFTQTHIVPSDGAPYDLAALDPHAAIAYRLGAIDTVRVAFDHTTVAPKPLEVDRTDTANPAPFVPLAPESANDLTYSFEVDGRTKLRATYYADVEHNRIDVLPVDFRSAIANGQNPIGVGVPTNAGSLVAHGFDLWLQNGGLTFKLSTIAGQSSSASQFAYNGLNAAAVAAGHLFPLGYVPNLTAALSYEFAFARGRVRITPTISYESGYPYGNGTMVYTIDPQTGKPVAVPNDNYVNPGYNYYFLANPSLPFNAATNPYIGSLGTPEGADPNTLHSAPQTLVSIHVEATLTPRLTVSLDVLNVFATSTPNAMQGNPYLIGPPGYAGGNPLYAIAYQNAANFTQPYVLGNGVPTNDGVHAALPWQYGTAGYVPQGYPLARTLRFSLRYRL